MTSNHKLTSLIAGRTLADTSTSGDALTITFGDASVMTVQTNGTAESSAATGEAVTTVQQSGTTLTLNFSNGGIMEITTAEETSSVMVRGRDHILEYAD